MEVFLPKHILVILVCGVAITLAHSQGRRGGVDIGTGSTLAPKSILIFLEPSFSLSRCTRLGTRQEIFGIPASRLIISTSINGVWYPSCYTKFKIKEVIFLWGWGQVYIGKAFGKTLISSLSIQKIISL
ncbi:MAG: hypothetical protein JST69_04945 [Bacteroidetes bacterium]|nr:hypothetical protein [Bacteroidota bacterium]